MNSPEISAAKPSARLIVPPRHPIQTAAVRQWRSWRTGDLSHLKLGTPPVVLAGCGKTTGRIPFPRPAGPKIGLREGLPGRFGGHFAGSACFEAESGRDQAAASSLGSLPRL